MFKARAKLEREENVLTTVEVAERFWFVNQIGVAMANGALRARNAMRRRWLALASIVPVPRQTFIYPLWAIRLHGRQYAAYFVARLWRGRV